MVGKKTKGRVVVPDASALAMANRFKGYKPEEEKAVRKADVVESEGVKQIRAAWKDVVGWGHAADLPGFYDNYVKRLEGLGYSAPDVEGFSLSLTGFPDIGKFSKNASYFLSALINNCKDSDFTIHLSYLGVCIRYFGYRNTKNVTLYGDIDRGLGEHMSGGSILVEGNVGEHAGCNMTSGTITVNGNAGEGFGAWLKGGDARLNGNAEGYAGAWMEAGTVTVNGNAWRRAGWEMRNGMITVNGDAGEEVGAHMKGGEIHLNGDYGSISDGIGHGKIYHKGKLIVDK